MANHVYRELYNKYVSKDIITEMKVTRLTWVGNYKKNK